jgi:hypothetical protein
MKKRETLGSGWEGGGSRSPAQGPSRILPFHMSVTFSFPALLVFCPEDGATSFFRNVSNDLPHNVTFQKTINPYFDWSGNLLLAFASTAILGFGPCWTLDRICFTCHHPEYLRSNVCSKFRDPCIIRTCVPGCADGGTPGCRVSSAGSAAGTWNKWRHRSDWTSRFHTSS